MALRACVASAGTTFQGLQCTLQAGRQGRGIEDPMPGVLLVVPLVSSNAGVKRSCINVCKAWVFREPLMVEMALFLLSSPPVVSVA